MSSNIKKEYEFGFNDGKVDVSNFSTGHSKQTVMNISSLKNEPKWMLDLRLKAYDVFLKTKMPNWGPSLKELDLDSISYYVKPTNVIAEKWEDVPEKIRNTFDKLGINKQEQEWLGGIATQYDSEMVYAKAEEELEAKGVIFCSTDDALKKHPEILKKYFSKLVDETNNKFAALNLAFWSGGSFIYIPENVVLDNPLQSYFRINARGAGQFERTLIIVDKGAKLHYIEGCTAPTYSIDSLHAAVVEVFVEEGATCKYTTVQHWSDNVINLVTKSSIVETNGLMEWVDGNIGSKINMKYPSTLLKGDNSSGMTLSMAMAIGDGIVQDAGAKMIHIGKNTKSTILSKSISGHGGRVNYRGLVEHKPEAIGSKSKVECDTMILDKDSKSDTIPTNIVKNNTSTIEHEAVVSKMSEKEIYYLQSRGLTRNQAREIIVIGFLDEFVNAIPEEYSSELTALLKMEMEGDIG